MAYLASVGSADAHALPEMTGLCGFASHGAVFILGRAAIAEHPLILRFAGKAVGFLAGSGGSFSRGADGRAENTVA
jgi:hypothetical protein